MRRRILMVLLALGVVGGYGGGLASCAYRAHHGGYCHGYDDSRHDDGRARAGHAQAGDPQRGSWHW